jgi:uridylate kinase
MTADLCYQRIVLKLSGEFLLSLSQNISGVKIAELAKEIQDLTTLGVAVVIVIGAGNLLRGASCAAQDLERSTADQMGMLATIINGLALRDGLLHHGVAVELLSAIAVAGIVDVYSILHAKRLLQAGKVVIVAGGTGNPLVTTDSAAALRGVELAANIVIKATKVDAVYTNDPLKFPEAQQYRQLSFAEVLQQGLQIIDLNAILLCRDYGLVIRVCNMDEPGNLRRIVLGEQVGTLIAN